MRKILPAALVVLLVACGAGSTEEESYLYVWAGPRRAGGGMETPPGNDVLVTIDMATNGAVNVVDVGSAGNEPHHLKRCGDLLYAGGLFSGKVFVFGTEDPAAPTLERVVEGSSLGLGAADDFACLGDGVLVTMMGNDQLGSPGGLMYIDDDGSVIGRYPTETPTGLFAPHGIDLDDHHDTGTIITTDFVRPASIAEETGPEAASTVRIWDLDTFTVTETVEVCTGPMEVHYLHGGTVHPAIVSCMVEGAWGVISRNPDGTHTYTEVVDIDGANSLEASPGGIHISADDTTFWIAAGGYGEVLRYDITDLTSPGTPITARVGTGAHFMTFSEDEARGYVSDYSLQQLEAALGMQEADNLVWRFDTETMTAEIVADFGADTTDPMIRELGVLQPHGMALGYD